jgi:dihydroflavonol-4-reductase
MFDVNITGTRNIVDACIEMGVERLVHTSSIAAIGFNPNGPADETNAFNWDPYDVGYRISKLRAEQEIRRGVTFGLPAIMVNPSIIIGPRDIHFHGGQIIRDVCNKRIFYYPDGGTNVVYIDDVVRGHIAAARQGRMGERYILGGENMTNKEMLTTTAEVVGGIKPLARIPKALATGIALSAEAIAALTRTKPWVTRELTVGIDLDLYFSSAKAARELNHRTTPFREAVQRTFEWYKANGFL